MKLHGSRALVTGASRGLGAAIAAAFTKERAIVHTCARTVGQCPNKDMHTIIDVSQPYAFNTLADGPHFDILVCNAAISGPVGPFYANPIDAWEDTIRVNLLGVARCCRAFVPRMKAKGGGKIIILSGGGAVAARPNFSAYATSKAAVVRFAETLALELRPYSIDVNCMAPGLLNTSIHDPVLDAGPVEAGAHDYQKSIEAKKGPADFKAACDLAVWLASKDSNRITGKLISVHHDYRKISP